MPADTLAAFDAAFDAVSHLTVADESVVLIGEHHESEASATLVRDVLDTATPALVAIESSPSQQQLFTTTETNISAGADVAVEYARQHSAPIGLIDKSHRDILTDIPLSPTPPSCTPPEPTDDGDISHDAIAQYRDTLQRECPQRYDRLLVDREQHMAGMIRTLAETTAGGLVAILGAGHLPAVSTYLDEHQVPPLDVTDDRIRTVE